MSEANSPDKIPDKIKSFDRFVFHNKANSLVKSEIESQISTLEERISKISNTVTLDGLPIINFILQHSHDKKDLKKLAKAIDRIADLIELADQLEVKQKIIQTAESDPSWFALAFGDFQDEIDEDIKNIFN